MPGIIHKFCGQHDVGLHFGPVDDGFGELLRELLDPFQLLLHELHLPRFVILPNPTFTPHLPHPHPPPHVWLPLSSAVGPPCRGGRPNLSAGLAHRLGSLLSYRTWSHRLGTHPRPGLLRLFVGVLSVFILATSVLQLTHARARAMGKVEVWRQAGGSMRF